MKTHKSIVILALASAILTPLSHANLLADKAKLEKAKSEAQAAATSANPPKDSLTKVAEAKAYALNAFETGAADKFGNDWIERWQNSKYPNPDDEAGDMYISGKVFSPTFPAAVQLSVAKQRQVLAHIAAKEKLVREDLQIVQVSSVYDPKIANRLDEFAALLPSKGIKGEEYFFLKHITLLKKPMGGTGSKAFAKHMAVSDWFELASSKAHFSPSTFHSMRDAMIATTARLLIDKRRAANLPVEGPEFDAAFAPVLDAIKAPNFQGLAEAVNSLGINLAIPTHDYSDQEATAELVADAATRNATLLSAWDTQHGFQDGLGSVMFIKGESTYREWRESLLQPR